MSGLTQHEIDRDCWAFALKLYAQPGISPACLRLQSAAGLDVMMMLSVVFAAVRLNLTLSDQQLQALDELCTPWREQIVRPLRAVRVQLKTGPAPAPSADTEALRNQIKASELAAERLQTSLVASFFATRTSRMSSGTVAVDLDGLIDLLRRMTGGRAGARQASASSDYDKDLCLIAEAARAI